MERILDNPAPVGSCGFFILYRPNPVIKGKVDSHSVGILRDSRKNVNLECREETIIGPKCVTWKYDMNQSKLLQTSFLNPILSRDRRHPSSVFYCRVLPVVSLRAIRHALKCCQPPDKRGTEEVCVLTLCSGVAVAATLWCHTNPKKRRKQTKKKNR